jgi:maltose alpha-D-glucosyltransferase/alpha-amylase
VAGRSASEVAVKPSLTSTTAPTPHVVLAVLAILLVAALDWVTGRELGLSLFYAVPIFAVSRSAGARAGLVTAVAGSLLWGFSDAFAGEPYVRPWLPWWNAANRLGFFLIVVWLSATRQALVGERERSRTDSLTGLLNQDGFAEAARSSHRPSQPRLHHPELHPALQVALIPPPLLSRRRPSRYYASRLTSPSGPAWGRRRRARVTIARAAMRDALWYKDAVFYELHVKAYTDANGDGMGDFPGLLTRLDHLKDLGVDCLWLLPMYPSPLRDDGYDISDYCAIHPQYGTLDDFKTFLSAAHERGLRVITELVVNHTSDQHPWFKEARSSPESPKRDYYVWSDTDDRYRGVRIIFRDTEMSNWAWDPVSKAYYWHRFFSHQPDLNFDNPAVREEIWQVMRFWLELGVDGFRVDAVPYLVEREGTSCENLLETHAVLRELRRRMDAGFPGRMLLAEANMWPEDVRPYFGDGDEFHMAFHFPIMPRMFMALRLEDRKPLVEIIERTPDIPAACQWGLFLRNHDELTLEMVTDAERDYMYEEYARDPVARINLGIRRRLAPLLDGDRRRIELMNALLLSLPGSPVLYYGDEIGMGDNVYLGDRNGVRTPMQWTGGWNGGFATADPERLYQPLISNPVYGYQAVNVESQRRQENSLLNWTKRLIQVRRSTQVFGRGSIEFLKPANHRVLAYVRSLDSEKVLVVNNLSGTAQAVELDLRALAGAIPIEMFGRSLFPRIRDRPYVMTLGPYDFFWFRLRWL